jgi:hypothetical protein
MVAIVLNFQNAILRLYLVSLRKVVFDNEMKYSVIVTFALAALESAARPQDATPPKPSNMPKLGGAPIPFGPAPTGCNLYEVLIGKHAPSSSLKKCFLILAARGTSEPGPFGVSE